MPKFKTYAAEKSPSLVISGFAFVLQDKGQRLHMAAAGKQPRRLALSYEQSARPKVAEGWESVTGKGSGKPRSWQPESMAQAQAQTTRLDRLDYLTLHLTGTEV